MKINKNYFLEAIEIASGKSKLKPTVGHVKAMHVAFIALSSKLERINESMYKAIKNIEENTAEKKKAKSS